MTLFTLQSSILEIILRTGIVFAALMVFVRLFGKKEIGQMAPNDLVLLLLISNAVQNAMVGADQSVPGGLAAVGTLLALNFLLTFLASRSKSFRSIVEGKAAILIHRGTVVSENLKKEKVSILELEQALREHGVAAISDVYLAVLELDGSISVLKKDEIPAETKPHHTMRFLKR